MKYKDRIFLQSGRSGGRTTRLIDDTVHYAKSNMAAGSVGRIMVATFNTAIDIGKRLQERLGENFDVWVGRETTERFTLDGEYLNASELNLVLYYKKTITVVDEIKE